MIERIRDTLHNIGKKHVTDKFAHRFKGVTYLHIYDLYFRYLRHVDMSILELGIKRGASLKSWHDYFTEGQIYGLDKDAKCKRYKTERTHIIISKQNDKTILDKLGKFDIILDDCSHINKLTLESFKHLWSHVKPGGYYVIEDLRTSYGWTASKEGKLNKRDQMNKIFFDIIDKLDHTNGDVMFIHFWSMVCIIRKV